MNNKHIYEAKKPDDVKYEDPFRLSNDDKKFGVYVKNPDTGNDLLVKFGDPNMEIKRDDDEARKAFRARHNCSEKNDKTTAGYWSCKMWQKGKSVSDMLEINLNEATVNTVGPDDGPSFMYPSHDTYRRASTKDLQKYIETGWSIVSHMMDDGTEEDIMARIYPNGPVGSVSFFPAGDIDDLTPNNQENLFGSEAYDKWKIHTLDTIAKLGWEWIEAKGDKEDAEAAVKDAESAGEEAEKQKDKEEKHKEKIKEQTIRFIKVLENNIDNIISEDSVVNSDGINTLIDVLINSMENFDEKSFVKFLSKETKYKKDKLKKIFNAYWDLPPKKRFGFMKRDWVDWLREYEITVEMKEVQDTENKFEKTLNNEPVDLGEYKISRNTSINEGGVADTLKKYANKIKKYTKSVFSKSTSSSKPSIRQIQDVVKNNPLGSWEGLEGFTNGMREIGFEHEFKRDGNPSWLRYESKDKYKGKTLVLTDAKNVVFRDDDGNPVDWKKAKPDDTFLFYENGMAGLLLTDKEIKAIANNQTNESAGCGCGGNSINEEDPCWDGYVQLGMKEKDGKEVPNCVPEGDVKEALSEAISKSFTSAVENFRDEQLKLQKLRDVQKKLVDMFKKSDANGKKKLKKKLVDMHKAVKKQKSIVDRVERDFNKAIMDEPDSLEELMEALSLSARNPDQRNAILKLLPVPLEDFTQLKPEFIKMLNNFYKSHNIAAKISEGEELSEGKLKDLVDKGKEMFKNAIRIGEPLVDDRVYKKLNQIAREFGGNLAALAKDGDVVRFAVQTRGGVTNKFKYNTKTGDVSLSESVSNLGVFTNREDELVRQVKLRAKSIGKKKLDDKDIDNWLRSMGNLNNYSTAQIDNLKKKIKNINETITETTMKSKTQLETIKESYSDKSIDAKTLAGKMKKIDSMKGLAKKIEKKGGKLTPKDLDSILPDYVSGSDIEKLFEILGENTDVKKKVNETHWITPQEKKAFAKKHNLKMNDVEYDGFGRVDKDGKVTGYAYVPNEKHGYKLTVDSKTGKILNVQQESVNENKGKKKPKKPDPKDYSGWQAYEDAVGDYQKALKKYNESLNEAVKPSDSIKKILSISDTRQNDTVGDVRVDSTTAHKISKVWDRANDSNKKKMNKLGVEELVKIVDLLSK